MSHVQKILAVEPLVHMMLFQYADQFAFVGLEVLTGIILVILLKFFNVEKTVPLKQAEIKAM